MRGVYVFFFAVLFSCSDTEIETSDTTINNAGGVPSANESLGNNEEDYSVDYTWESDQKPNQSFDIDDSDNPTYSISVLDEHHFSNFSTSAAANSNLNSTAETPLVNKAKPSTKPSVSDQPKNTQQQSDNFGQKSLKIIKDGAITVRSENIDSSKFKIDKLVHHLNGYFSKDNMEEFQNRVVYQLVIRVPSVNYDKLLNGIRKGGDKIESKNIVAMDVTEEYSDLQTQLENKRSYLKRYQQLLAQAKNVKEVLMIEDYIRPLQIDIERHLGRLRYLDDKVGYSTLSIQLYQEFEVVKKDDTIAPSFWSKLGNSVEKGWGFVLNFILNITAIWPQLIIVFIVLFVLRRRRKNIIAWFKK